MLEPFREKDTVEYITARLEKVGVPDQNIFPIELLQQIHVRSQGIPRLINGICDNLLLTAFAMEKHTCTLQMLDEVSHDMRLEWPGQRQGPRVPRSRYGGETLEQAPFYTRGD
jgi:general secretion pathway protein A